MVSLWRQQKAVVVDTRASCPTCIFGWRYRVCEVKYGLFEVKIAENTLHDRAVEARLLKTIFLLVTKIKC